MNDEAGLYIAAGALALAFAAVAGIHYAVDASLYGAQYNGLRTELAQRTAATCDAGNRAARLNQDVSNNIAKVKSSYTWLPSKQTAELLETAKKDNIVLFPVSFHQAAFVWPDNIDGVVYKEAGEAPVLAYRHLSAEKLKTVAAQLESGQLPEGASVIRSAKGGYTITPATAAEASAETNPCFKKGTEAGKGHEMVGKRLIKPAVKVIEHILRPD
jgi:hypothetical protein